MKTFYATIMALFACAVLAFGAQAETPPETTPAPVAAVVGQPAPSFTATDTNGQRHDLNAYRGKTVVLEWTNHECPFVVKHYGAGNMQALQKEATGQGVIWLTVNSSAEGGQGYTTPEQANEIIAKNGAAATARILDPEGAIGMMYGAKTTPHMFVINPEGTLVYAGGIDDNPSSDPSTIAGARNHVREALADIAAGRPVAVAQSNPYGCGVKYKG